MRGLASSLLYACRQRSNMNATKLDTIEIAMLDEVIGGKDAPKPPEPPHRSVLDRLKNVGKAAVNGLYNILPDKVTSVGAKGASVDGEWDKRRNLGDKPFKDDPLAKARGDA